MSSAALRFRVKRIRGAFNVSAYIGRKRVGNLNAYERAQSWSVGQILVLPEYQRQKIATGLYRQAAQLACELGKPLQSEDYQRSPAATGVWRAEQQAGLVERDEGRFWYPCDGRSLRVANRLANP